MIARGMALIEDGVSDQLLQRILSNDPAFFEQAVLDLLIAAIAECADLTVLHVDEDFELIADVTDQPIERLAGDF